MSGLWGLERGVCVSAYKGQLFSCYTGIVKRIYISGSISVIQQNLAQFNILFSISLSRLWEIRLAWFSLFLLTLSSCRYAPVAHSFCTPPSLMDIHKPRSIHIHFTFADISVLLTCLSSIKPCVNINQCMAASHRSTYQLSEGHTTQKSYPWQHWSEQAPPTDSWLIVCCASEAALFPFAWTVQ